MSSRNERFEYGLATPEDSAEILNIYESGDFKGKISVLYTRRPDPYRSLMNEGERVFIPVIREKETGKICAVGCCVIREAYINGEVKKVGYLTGLKVLPEFRKRTPHIVDVYSYLHENTKEEVDIYYTTILEENIGAQKILEKKRKNMPEYHYKGIYTVYCFRTGKAYKSNQYFFEKGNIEGLREFYELQSKSYNFSPINLGNQGQSNDHSFALRDNTGTILAACEVWNQQSYKQYIVTGYSGIYKWLSKLPTKLLGFPPFPKKNSPANYACVSMFFVKDNDSAIAEYLLKKVSECVKEYDFLMLGLFEDHPLDMVFNNIKHIKYKSKFYTVQWDNEAYQINKNPYNIEVGLL